MQIERLTGSSIELRNEGQLDLLFIGTGSAFSKTLHQNNLIIVKGDQHLLVDCGTRCPHGLFELDIGVRDIDNFLITHTHADHIGGLEEVMMLNRYGGERKKANIIINDEFEEILWNHSLRGGAAHSEVHNGQPLGFEDFWHPLRPDRLEGMPRETWSAQLGEMELLMPRTMHFPDNAKSWRDSFWSCGLIIDRRILFTSDTRFDPQLVRQFDALFNFEIIFHDCQLFTGGVHASFDELSTLPRSIKERMILMHYGDNWKAFEEQLKEQGFRGFARSDQFYRFPQLKADTRTAHSGS